MLGMDFGMTSASSDRICERIRRVTDLFFKESKKLVVDVEVVRKNYQRVLKTPDLSMLSP